ncbi:unnamed protein product [Calypogeia fissa]
MPSSFRYRLRKSDEFTIVVGGYTAGARLPGPTALPNNAARQPPAGLPVRSVAAPPAAPAGAQQRAGRTDGRAKERTNRQRPVLSSPEALPGRRGREGAFLRRAGWPSLSCFLTASPEYRIAVPVVRFVRESERLPSLLPFPPFSSPRVPSSFPPHSLAHQKLVGLAVWLWPFGPVLESFHSSLPHRIRSFH